MRRRLLLALGFSLGLHALLFVLLLRLNRDAARVAEQQRPMVVEVLERPTPRTTRAPERAPGRVEGSSRAQAPTVARPQAPASRSTVPDAPHASPDLYPQGAFAVALPAPPEAETPDAGPPGAVIAQRIQAWRLGNLAEQRVATGVDSYFSTLAHALRDGLGRPPPPGSPKQGTPSAGQLWMKAWLDQLAAADSPPPPPPPPAERGPTQPVYDFGGREGDMLARTLGPMAPTAASLMAPFELFKSSQVPPSAVLRIEQDAEGHLVRVELLASSGDPTFDAWVKRSAPLALAAVPRPPDHGAGLHPEGTRSDWAFYRTGDGVNVLLLRVY